MDITIIHTAYGISYIFVCMYMHTHVHTYITIIYRVSHTKTSSVTVKIIQPSKVESYLEVNE